MKKRDSLIHSTLESIEWDYVTLSFEKLSLPWYEDKRPTKSDIVNELVSLINNAIDEPGKEIITEYWTVTFWTGENQEEFLQILFTPITVFASTRNSTNKLERKVENLKERMNLYLKQEDYVKMSKAHKQLIKLEKVLNQQK